MKTAAGTSGFEGAFGEDTLRRFFQRIDLWYVESALSSFSFEEFVKIFLLVLRSVNPLSVKHISFEPLMKDMYRDYQGVRHINVYKNELSKRA
ncbi:hypothetical protein PO124_12585 [Bacillus licheniformis]|nr:hypothetical protein [Bacillus licheniformis]